MYDEKFNKAFDYVIGSEGGYVYDPNDAGGETKYGISKASYPNVDIKNLTLDGAKEIYYNDYWKKGQFDGIYDAALATKVFDFGVNMGVSAGSKMLQRALRAVNKEVTEDGIIGPKTLEATNTANSANLLAALKSEAAGYYRMIANNNPTQKCFLNGWLNRAYKSVNV